MGHWSHLYGLQSNNALEWQKLETCDVVGEAKNFVPLMWLGCYRKSDLKWTKVDKQPFAELFAPRTAVAANMQQFADRLCKHDDLRKHLPTVVMALEKSLSPFKSIQLDLYDYSFLYDNFRVGCEQLFDYVDGIVSGKIAYRDILEDPLAKLAFETSGIFVPELETQFGGKMNLEYMLSGLACFYTKPPRAPM